MGVSSFFTALFPDFFIEILIVGLSGLFAALLPRLFSRHFLVISIFSHTVNLLRLTYAFRNNFLNDYAHTNMPIVA